MKKIVFLFCLCFFLLVKVNTSYAVLISFLAEDNFAGVDNIWGFSTTDQLNNLGTSSISLLNGTATLEANRYYQEATLTQRGTRGLGILGGSYDDQIDWVTEDVIDLEWIDFNFNTPVRLEWVEFRSFYAGQFLYSNLPTNEYCGWIHATATYGEGVYRFKKSALVIPNTFSCMYFGFDDVGDSKCHFSLARLNVSPIAPVPEPSSLFLLGFGLSGLGLLRRQR